MATKECEIKTELTGNDDFAGLVMDALGNFPNYATSVSGNQAKCDEISAPKVGMGFNTWQRGRAYSVITFNEADKTITISTSINGLTGGAWNGKYAGEICEMLASKLKNDMEKRKRSVKATVAALSPADEIKKFKDLLDQGIITQEEFDAKKKQLLGL